MPRQRLTATCDITFAGLAMREGHLVDTVTPMCDLPSPTHLLMRVQVEQRIGDLWTALGRTTVISALPDATGYPVKIDVDVDGHEGTYRTTVHMEGNNPDGTPYTIDTTSNETHLTRVLAEPLKWSVSEFPRGSVR